MDLKENLRQAVSRQRAEPDLSYEEPVDISYLHLQESEVSEVIWMDYGECCENVAENRMPHCIYMEELEILERHLEF